MTFTELLTEINNVFLAVWNMILALLTFDQPLLSISTYLGIVALVITMYRKLRK